jgi:hypothetical protein
MLIRIDNHDRNEVMRSQLNFILHFATLYFSHHVLFRKCAHVLNNSKPMSINETRSLFVSSVTVRLLYSGHKITASIVDRYK